MTHRNVENRAPMAKLISQVVSLRDDGHDACAHVQCATRGAIDAELCKRCARLVRIDVCDGDLTMLCRPADEKP